MSKDITEQDVLRNNITYNMFVDSADQNYVVSRWCFQNNLSLDFLWNATHCLEKMMKAVLLLNGLSAKRAGSNQPTYGHNLALLYPQILSLTGELLPDKLEKPKEIDMPWRIETSEKFIERISMNGDANNRYQMYGHSLEREDLYKFDRMVFAIRRLCCPLDKYLFGSIRNGEPSITFRQQLKKQKKFMPRMVGSRWKKLTDVKARNDLRHAALNHNFMFAPDYDHRDLRCGSSRLNSVLGRRLLRPDEQGVSGKRAEETAELIEWVIENIYLPGSVKNDLKGAQARLESRI